MKSQSYRTAGGTQAALARAMEHHQAGRLVDAEALYRRVLDAEPGNALAWHLLGALANQCGQPAAAVELISQAIRINPRDAASHNNLGVAYQSLGRCEEAAASYERALALQPDNLDALNNLGAVLQALGRPAEALASYERVLKPRPNSPEILVRIGGLLTGQGRYAEAETRLRRALKLRPGYPDALTSLGGALLGRGQIAEALEACTRAVALAPNDSRAHQMLGNVQRWSGDVHGGIRSYERALALNPDAPETLQALGSALLVAGHTAEAAEVYRRCLALDPASPITLSALIFALDLTPGAEEQARAERRRYNEQLGQPWRQHPPVHTNSRDPDRPLRVGYVSADFHQHSASTAFMPILRAHDPSQIRVYCYSGSTTPDAITAEAKALARAWRDVAFLTDDELEARIRADEIDILVDLSGHSAGNRLPVFARQPAPVQVTAWGYATGTGLDAVHYFLADEIVVPPADRQHYAETVVSLPSAICYAAPADLPDVAPPPVQARGFVTFGAFNRLPKISDVTMAAWGQVLATVPSARLVIKCAGADVSPAREELLARLAGVGVEPARVTLLGGTTQQEHLAAHAEIDVMLDTFPHAGGVTTVETLLMGVPMVTLLGEGVPGRLSASFLAGVGLSELAANTPAEYVEIAQGLAGRLDWLAEQRTTLRARLLASPVGDTQAYTRAVEAAYRGMWRRWCNDLAPSLSPTRRGVLGGEVSREDEAASHRRHDR